MNKKFLFVLVVTSCFFSLFAFIRAFSRYVPVNTIASSLQTSVANSSVSVKVNGGVLSLSKLPSPTMSAVDASTDSQTTLGSLGEIEVTDLRGTKGTGWTVNIDSMTDYYNSDNSESIPLTNTQFTVNDLSVTKGDSSFVVATAGTLLPKDDNEDKLSDGAITLAQTVGSSNGKNYSGVNVAKFKTDMSLTIPGGIAADTYTSVYTISVQ